MNLSEREERIAGGTDNIVSPEYFAIAGKAVKAISGGKKT